LTFDATTLAVAAGAKVTLAYANDSAIPHNWHLFEGADANAPSLAETPVKSGPQDVQTVQFSAPTQPGSYFFQCDVHPFMNGHLVVESAQP
jgi:plastocyanin